MVISCLSWAYDHAAFYQWDCCMSVHQHVAIVCVRTHWWKKSNESVFVEAELRFASITSRLRDLFTLFAICFCFLPAHGVNLERVGDRCHVQRKYQINTWYDMTMVRLRSTNYSLLCLPGASFNPLVKNWKCYTAIIILTEPTEYTILYLQLAAAKFFSK